MYGPKIVVRWRPGFLGREKQTIVNGYKGLLIKIDIIIQKSVVQ